MVIAIWVTEDGKEFDTQLSASVYEQTQLKICKHCKHFKQEAKSVGICQVEIPIFLERELAISVDAKTMHSDTQYCKAWIFKGEKDHG